jgi:hypothetical protein
MLRGAIVAPSLAAGVASQGGIYNLHQNRSGFERLVFLQMPLGELERPM